MASLLHVGSQLRAHFCMPGALPRAHCHGPLWWAHCRGKLVEQGNAPAANEASTAKRPAATTATSTE